MQCNGAGSRPSKDFFFKIYQKYSRNMKNKTSGGAEPATCDTLPKRFSTKTSES